MIKLIKSTFYKERQTKLKLVSFIRKADSLSFGQQCQKFEKRFGAWQKRKYSVFLNSGSSANIAIIQALLNLGLLKRGDYVGFSAVTWSTNVMPLLQLGLQAIPVDINLATLNVSSASLQQTLKRYPLRMFFLTNLLGFCDDIDAISDLCSKKHILLVEDNCESLGSVYKGKRLGNFGIASTCSFYVGHHMSTIEGGVVCTDDEEIATMLNIVRAHGWDRNLTFAKQNEIRKKFCINSEFYSRYTFYDLGFNLRPTEINGFLGNTQLSYIEEIIAKRQQNFLKLAPILYGGNKYFPLSFRHLDVISNFAVPLVCKTQKQKDELIRRCRNIIETRPIVGGNITQQPFYAKYMKHVNALHCPIARLVHAQGLYFGNNPELTKKDLNTILEVFAG